MPRIRTIKPEFFADEKLGPLDLVARFTFLGLISMADDMGRVLDNVKQIDAFVFPYTDESAREALVELEASGRIRRGLTPNGLRVIQIVNWHHQKIDKPNFASCLPAIAGDPDDAATRYQRNKRIPDRVRDEAWRRDQATCQRCGTSPLRRDKRDRYDSAPDLGEIDHKTEAADGGDNSLENLELLCLPCNRKKAGANVARRNAERSENDRRRVDDVSKPHTSTSVPTTGDQRSAISESDRGPDERELPAALIETLPVNAKRLLAMCYEPAFTPSARERYRNVAMQLVDTIDAKHPGPKIRGGLRVKARSIEHLDDCCLAVVNDPPKDRDAAIVFVLKKLTDPPKGPSVTELAKRDEAAAIALEEQYQVAAKRAGIAWAKAHPAEYEQIRAGVDSRYGKTGSAWAATAREAELTHLTAREAGFPSFDAWKLDQRGAA